eukprot:COSAG02_NODE_7588_length_2945_cov_4.708607_2_plen_235_part_00
MCYVGGQQRAAGEGPTWGGGEAIALRFACQRLPVACLSFFRSRQADLPVPHLMRSIADVGSRRMYRRLPRIRDVPAVRAGRFGASEQGERQGQGRGAAKGTSGGLGRRARRCGVLRRSTRGSLRARRVYLSRTGARGPPVRSKTTATDSQSPTPLRSRTRFIQDTWEIGWWGRVCLRQGPGRGALRSLSRSARQQCQAARRSVGAYAVSAAVSAIAWGAWALLSLWRLVQTTKI